MGRRGRDKVLLKTLLLAWQHTVGRDLVGHSLSLRSEEFVPHSGALHQRDESPKMSGFRNQWGFLPGIQGVVGI